MDPDSDLGRPSGSDSSGATVAVTGASGFVGAAVVSALSDNGVRVRALSRTEPKNLPTGVAWIQSPELDESSDWGRSLEGCSAVVHCAARVHVMNDRASDPLSEFRRVNCAGTLKLARDAAAAGVERMVFISSIKVNGEGTSPGQPYRATDVPGPVDPYGISKREAEDLLFGLAKTSGMQMTVIRPVLVYGPGVRANFAALIQLVSMGVPLPLSSVDNQRSMVYVGNLADLVATAAFHPNAANRVLLVSDGRDLSTADMVRMLAAAMSRQARLVPIPTRLLSLVARMLGRRALAKRLLGSLTVDIAPTCESLSWRPPHSIEHAFAETVRAFERTKASAG